MTDHPNDDAAGDEAIAELWAQVRPNQLVLLHEVRVAVAATRADPTDTASWAIVRSGAHRLAGTLGSFNQVAAGDVALGLEELIGGHEQPDPELVERAAALVEALHAAMTHEHDVDGTPI